MNKSLPNVGPLKKILFIFPTPFPAYPLQIGSLSAFIKQFGFKTKLLPLIVAPKVTPAHLETVKKTLEEFKPGYVGFSAYETAFTWIREISKYVKQNWPEIKVIVGGYYPTLSPEDVIQTPSIDIICRGEGENPLKDLMATQGKDTSIKNLWFKKDGKIIKNQIRPLMKNLDELPFPDREMVDYQELIDAESDHNIKVMATRGCLYECTYCVNKHIRAIYPDPENYYRTRSPENVVAELKYIKDHYKFDYVGFHDDNITINLAWLKKFLELYKKEIGMKFYCATRVEMCSNEVLDMLKDAGCFMVLIGIESGNEEYRKNMLKRFMSNKTLIDAFRRIRERGILRWSFAMVGLPYETRKMLWETVRLNWQCRPDFVMSSIYYPFRGTTLGNLCYENNWVNLDIKDSVDNISWTSILNLPTLTQADIFIAKCLNSMTAVRSRYFWQAVFGRIHAHLIR